MFYVYIMCITSHPYKPQSAVRQKHFLHFKRKHLQHFYLAIHFNYPVEEKMG